MNALIFLYRRVHEMPFTCRPDVLSKRILMWDQGWSHYLALRSAKLGGAKPGGGMAAALAPSPGTGLGTRLSRPSGMQDARLFS